MKFLVLLLIPTLVNASNLTQFFSSSSALQVYDGNGLLLGKFLSIDGFNLRYSDLDGYTKFVATPASTTSIAPIYFSASNCTGTPYHPYVYSATSVGFACTGSGICNSDIVSRGAALTSTFEAQSYRNPNTGQCINSPVNYTAQGWFFYEVASRASPYVPSPTCVGLDSGGFLSTTACEVR